MSAERERHDGAVAGAELAKGSLVNVVETLARNLRAIFTFLIARLLGGATLGIFSTAWNLTDIITQGAKFGLDQGMTTLVATAEAKNDFAGSRSLLKRGLFWGVSISVATAAAAIAALRIWGERAGYDPEVVTMGTVLLCAIPGITLYYVGNGFSRGKKVMRHSILSKGLVENATTIGVFVLLIVAGVGRLAPGLAVLVGTACGGLVAVRLAVRLMRRSPAGEPTGKSPHLIRFSAPIAGYQLLYVLAQNMDIVLLATYVGKVPGITLTSLGFYAASIEIARGSRKLRQFIEPIFTPIVAGQLSAERYELVEESWNLSQRWMIALILALVGVLAVGGGLALAIFGPEFRRGLVWMWILTATYGVLSLTYLNDLLLMVQRPTINLMNSGLAVGLQLALMIWAIPRYGFVGAALSMLASAIVLAAVTLLELRLFFDLHSRWSAVRRPLKAFVLALAPAVVSRWLLASVLSTLWPAELVAALVFLGAYFAAWRWLGLDEADSRVVDQMRGRLRQPKPRRSVRSLVDS